MLHLLEVFIITNFTRVSMILENYCILNLTFRCSTGMVEYLGFLGGYSTALVDMGSSMIAKSVQVLRNVLCINHDHTLLQIAFENAVSILGQATPTMGMRLQTETSRVLYW